MYLRQRNIATSLKRKTRVTRKRRKKTKAKKTPKKQEVPNHPNHFLSTTEQAKEPEQDVEICPAISVLESHSSKPCNTEDNPQLAPHRLQNRKSPKGPTKRGKNKNRHRTRLELLISFPDSFSVWNNSIRIVLCHTQSIQPLIGNQWRSKSQAFQRKKIPFRLPGATRRDLEREPSFENLSECLAEHARLAQVSHTSPVVFHIRSRHAS